ncbi:MAG: hypothetical protein L3K08_02530 [Thermoplasmata archaeon]|nr:hypothetical protein [Thermoplasmata archaeon]
MGRTVPTYRDALEDHLARWEREFGRGLPDPVDRANFQRILQGARRYVAQATMMGSGDLVERILLSVLLDLERELHAVVPGETPRTPGPTAAGPDGPRAPGRRPGPSLDAATAP